jgi:hypothetical protein
VPVLRIKHLPRGFYYFSRRLLMQLILIPTIMIALKKARVLERLSVNA